MANHVGESLDSKLEVAFKNKDKTTKKTKIVKEIIKPAAGNSLCEPTIYNDDGDTIFENNVIWPEDMDFTKEDYPDPASVPVGYSTSQWATTDVMEGKKSDRPSAAVVTLEIGGLHSSKNDHASKDRLEDLQAYTDAIRLIFLSPSSTYDFETDMNKHCPEDEEKSK